MAIRVFAPAKINLALHVVGQRPDSYHQLDSLVAFANVGDWLTLKTSQAPSFVVSGPEAAFVPTDGSNVVMQVAGAFWHAGPLDLHLEKNLPVASGIGGGSADAAACYRGLRQLLSGSVDVGVQTSPADLRRLLAMGADVPMCVASRPARVRGIGEQIEPLNRFPILHAVLVNPRVPVPTPAVFKTLAHKDNAPLDEIPQEMPDSHVLMGWLARQRNDLEVAAIALAPVISVALQAVDATKDCLLSRMSGSGATCFGLYASGDRAAAAADSLRAAYPDWWIMPTILGGKPRAHADIS